MKFFPLMPLVFISAYVFIAISIAVDRPETALTATGVLTAFLLLYFFTKKKSSTHPG